MVGLLSAVLLAPACKKTELVDPASCPTNVADLRAFLAIVAEEGDVEPELIVDPADESHHLARPFPRMPLVTVDERPARLSALSLLTLQARVVAHDRYTTSVADARGLDEVAGRAASSVLAPSFGFGGLGYFYSFHPISLLISENERWEDVVAVATAAMKHGVSPIEFVFAVKSRAKSPALDAPSATRMMKLAFDSKEMPWRRDVALANELARANEHCPRVAAPFAIEAHDSHTMEEQRKDFMAQAGNAFASCSCRGDLAAIKTFAWARYGRHWGGTTVSYTLEVSPPAVKDEKNESIEVISAPAKATWREVHGRIIDASKRKTRVGLEVR